MRRIEEAACLSRWREHTAQTCVLCLGLGLCALAIPSLLAGSSVLALALGLACLAEIPLGAYLRRLLLAGGFALTSFLPLSVDIKIHPGLQLAWDPHGLETASLAGTRAIGMLSVTLLFAFTTPFPRFLSLLGRLRTPKSLLDLLALVHREIFLLDETFARLRKALACRNGWQDRHAGIRTLSLGTAALFVQAVRRSEAKARGMASRGALEGRQSHGVPVEIRPQAMLGAVLLPAGLAACILWGKARLGL